MMNMATQAPGYLEGTLAELKAKGAVDDLVTAAEVRDSSQNDKVKLVARPHAGIDTMVSTAQHLGHFYMQMLWTVFHAVEEEFLTSDAPVVRRDPGYTGGFYGGGLMSSTAQVWFPLSKTACLLITHDEERERKFFEFFESGNIEEAEAVRAESPEILGHDITAQFVKAVNHQTIVNADRFVYSPSPSDEISPLFRGKWQNYRIVIG